MRVLARILTTIQLTRLTIAFGAVSDLWFVVLLRRAAETHQAPLWLELAAAAIVAVGLYAYAASLNDILDARHDSTFAPGRPIPAGRITVAQAVIVAVGSLLVAVLSSAWFGTWSVCMTLLAAAGALFFNATGKYIPAINVVTVGLIHAVHMLIPWQGLRFGLPVALIMTHTMAIALHCYKLEDKRPLVSSRALAALIAGWLFWTSSTIGAMAWFAGSAWPTGRVGVTAAAPALAVLGFIVVARWKCRGAPPLVAAEKLRRYGAMWQSLYGASWLLALGHLVAAAWIGAFALAGFAAMTVIKEITGLSGRPIEFRMK